MNVFTIVKKFWEKLKKLLKEMWDAYLEYYQKYGYGEYSRRDLLT